MKIQQIIIFTFSFVCVTLTLHAQDGLPQGTYQYVNKGKNITETIRVVITETAGKVKQSFFYSNSTLKEKPLVLVKENYSSTETYSAGAGRMPVVNRTFKFADSPTLFTFKCERERLLRINPDKSVSPFILQYNNSPGQTTSAASAPTTDNINFNSYLTRFNNVFTTLPAVISVGSLKQDELNVEDEYINGFIPNADLIGNHSAVARVVLSPVMQVLITNYSYRFSSMTTIRIYKNDENTDEIGIEGEGVDKIIVNRNSIILQGTATGKTYKTGETGKSFILGADGTLKLRK